MDDPQKDRLLSLDVFRGIAVAALIVVLSPGNDTAYPLLRHADWDGCTLGDLVFPFFIFALGASLALSLSKHMGRGEDSWSLLKHIGRRTALLFSFGLLGSFLQDPHLATFRIPGVLQRLAVCYFFASLMFLKTGVRGQILTFAGILLGYWLLLLFVPAPGHGLGDLSREGNLVCYVDRLLLGKHIYHRFCDPEGLLSTLPAIATALLGTLAAQWLLSPRKLETKASGLLAAGIGLGALGRLWGLWFPINKGLWTSSYALFTGGLALGSLGTCFWMIEVRGWRRWGDFFAVYGANPLAAYVFSTVLFEMQKSIPAPSGGQADLREFLSAEIFRPTSPEAASLLYALGYALFCWLFLRALRRKGILLKV